MIPILVLVIIPNTYISIEPHDHTPTSLLLLVRLKC